MNKEPSYLMGKSVQLRKKPPVVSALLAKETKLDLF